MKPAHLCLVAMLFALGAARATAHPLAPALLDVTEMTDGSLAVVWKVSVFGLPGAVLRPALPADCRPTGRPTEAQDAESVTIRSTVRCDGAGLVGREIGVDGLVAGKSDALLRVTLADGRVVKSVLRAAAPRLTVPERDRPFDVVRAYAALGFEHIMTGPDHLLFVFGLLLLVGSGRLLVRTITAFTVGHSITLSLAALGLARVPPRPIEVGIALSVFVLAVELAREARPTPTLMQREPWAMAGVFGLLHGLGFAGALAEVGLPAGEIPTALFAFNVGIELGQLCFVGVVLVAASGLARLAAPRLVGARWIPVYAMGSLSALWCIERTLAVLPTW